MGTEIHLVPSMNPDGFEAVNRGNYNNVDLNRAFPGQELLHGVVSDASGEPVEAAHIQIQGREKDVLTTEMGEYWRVLAPGTYTLQAMKGDMASDEVTVTIGNDWRESSGQRLDLSLSKPLTRSQTTEPPQTTTTTTTTTTEAPPVDGTNLYILPGICINISLSFTPIKGCTEN